MLLGEPPPTAADIHFRCWGVPIRVHPLFWVVALLLYVGGGPVDPERALIWVAAVFVSIVIHEMGHALAFRHFGASPHVTLYGLGGLASANYFDGGPRAAIIIALAGPAAGFLLALALVVLMVVTGHGVGVSYFVPHVFAADFVSPVSYIATQYLLWINVLWGVLNLLPVYPLDGGQVAREALTLVDATTGIVRSLKLSLAAAALVALLAILGNRLFLAIMFGYLAYSSYKTLQAYSNSRGYGSDW